MPTESAGPACRIESPASARRFGAAASQPTSYPSAGVRRGPGGRWARGRWARGRRAGNGGRDLDGNVADVAIEQSCRLAELVVTFRVLLLLCPRAESLAELVHAAFTRPPLPNPL